VRKQNNISYTILLLGLVSGLLVLVLVPHFASRYMISFLILIFMYITLANSWNMLAGYAGYVSLGHGVFFGIGGYTFALCIMKLGFNIFLALIMSSIVTAMFALLIGLVLMTTRIRIAYFAIMTLGLNEIFKIVIANTESLGASYGFTLPPIPTLLIPYYIFLGLAILSVLVIVWIDKSNFGLGLKSILQDEEVAESIGVSTSKYKIMVFILSSIFPGVSGGAIAWFWSYIDPYLAFDLAISMDCAIMTIFGGSGTIWGPVIGAGFLRILVEMLWVKIPYFHAIIYSILLILIVIWAPGGLVELFRRLNNKFFISKSKGEEYY